MASAAALVPVALMYGALSCLRPSFESEGAGRTVISVWSSAVWANLIYAAGISLLAIVVWSAVPVRVRPYGAAAGIAGVLCVGMYGMAGMLNLRRPWVAAAPATKGPDGVAYLEGGNGDGDAWLLAELERSSYRTTAEILVGRPYDTYEAHVIRPSGDSAASIHFDRQGSVLVLSSKAGLAIRFDPRATTPPPQPAFDDEPLYRRRGRAESVISPFALVTDDVSGSQEDVRTILASIAEARDRHEYHPELWAPAERHLLDALDSPNQWIVETARRFIREGGETLYPEAMKRL